MTLDEIRRREKIAKRARRKPVNEAALMWSLGGILCLWVTFYVLKEYPTVPIPFGLSFLGACVAAGIVGGAVFAAVHLLITRPIVRKAAQQEAEWLHEGYQSTEGAKS
ncbi:MAG: hypothetical protein AAF439_00210 [Pseudomonadota bacterium]